jgi:hypothetical protein
VRLAIVTAFSAPAELRVIHTLPSSVPASSNPARIGDSLSDTIVPNISAPVMSGVMPPVVRVATRIFMVSAYDRSGEIGNMSSPRFTLLSTRLAPKYNVWLL